ncbi:MAG: L-histidine N(alpha)-methyltransferase [Nanoarchaeota archaeon]|nr:L-histidine N(alpha)-methyltransferase [Nanoarchaeota archaeon]
MYYNTKKKITSYSINSFKDKNYYSFLKKFIKKGEKIAIISLGCGNGEGEKVILEDLYRDGYTINYYGVDSSMSMIKLASKNLNKNSYPKSFICADFASENFRRDFELLVSNYDKRIFVFLGNTLGNVQQDYMADTLRNMLKSDDILWLDVVNRPDNLESTAGKNFERYSKFLNNPDFINFFKYPLDKLNIPFENGELLIEMRRENSLNALLFTFDFLINKKTEVEIDGEIVTLLPDDTIELINVRDYDVKSLIAFFESRHFKFQDKFSKNNKAEVVFKKL